MSTPTEVSAKTHKTALERFKLGTEANEKQVAREKEDLRFQVPEPEFQWSKEARDMRAGSTVGNVASPAKPMLCIPKLDQPIQLVLNQEKGAHLGVQIHALSEDADDDTAEIIQGLYRRIEVDSRAGIARSWAYERAVKCGRGAYRVLTEYADDGGHFTDQKIVIKRLLHQESVVLDPFAEEPDWSDGKWAFILSWMPWERYEAKYPKSKMATTDRGELDTLALEKPEWIKDDDAGRAVLIAEYFRLETETKTRVLLDDGSDSFDDAIPEGRTPHPENKSRREDVPKLKWSILNAVEELETEDRDGKYIPIIPVIGREIIPFDEERRWSGIISSNKDAQRLFNYAASQAVTVASLEPIAPFILDPRQIETYETQWNQANTKQYPYLPVTLDPNKGWGPPQRTQIDAGRLGPSMMLIQQADSFLHAGTGAFEAALGQGSPSNKTKGGILALQQQQEQGNSHFLDGLAEISIPYEARVVLDLIPFVYDRPGRVVRTLDLEDNAQTVMLNQPFVKGQNGRPQAVQPGQPPMQGQPEPKHFNLKKGQYGVIVSVGKSYQNRAQQGKDELGQLFQAEPALFQLLGDIYLKFADFPGHREAAERMKKMLPPPLQDKEDPKAAEQQLGQAKQALEQLQQQAGEMQKVIETKQVEQQAKVTIAKIGASQAITLQTMKDATSIAVARIAAAKEAMNAGAEDREEAIALHQQQTHDANQAAFDRQHELNQAQVEHEQALEAAQQAHDHAVTQAEQGQSHALEQGDQGQQNTLEAQQQAADLAPPPTDEAGA